MASTRYVMLLRNGKNWLKMPITEDETGHSLKKKIETHMAGLPLPPNVELYHQNKRLHMATPLVERFKNTKNPRLIISWPPPQRRNMGIGFHHPEAIQGHHHNDHHNNLPDLEPAAHGPVFDPFPELEDDEDVPVAMIPAAAEHIPPVALHAPPNAAPNGLGFPFGFLSQGPHNGFGLRAAAAAATAAAANLLPEGNQEMEEEEDQKSEVMDCAPFLEMGYPADRCLNAFHIAEGNSERTAGLIVSNRSNESLAQQARRLQHPSTAPPPVLPEPVPAPVAMPMPAIPSLSASSLLPAFGYGPSHGPVAAAPESKQRESKAPLSNLPPSAAQISALLHSLVSQLGPRSQRPPAQPVASPYVFTASQLESLENLKQIAQLVEISEPELHRLYIASGRNEEICTNLLFEASANSSAPPSDSATTNSTNP